MSDETLKPCPFCGGEAEAVHEIDDLWVTVECTECGALVDGIAAWNARATHSTLTAEQVRQAAHGHYKLSMVLDVDGLDMPQVKFDWQAIADELNARADDTRIAELKSLVRDMRASLIDGWNEETFAEWASDVNLDGRMRALGIEVYV